MQPGSKKEKTPGRRWSLKIKTHSKQHLFKIKNLMEKNNCYRIQDQTLFNYQIILIVQVYLDSNKMLHSFNSDLLYSCLKFDREIKITALLTETIF